MVNESAAVVVDDERAVANAGVMLPAVLTGRLGIDALVDQTVCLGERPCAANPGRKVMTMLSAMALGADCIEDCDVLRRRARRQVGEIDPIQSAAMRVDPLSPTDRRTRIV
jgi:hypothetical protein